MGALSWGPRMQQARRAVAAVMATLVMCAGLAATAPAPAADAAPPYFNPSTREGSIYRLYRAYFAREPDPAGFMYWYLQVARGTSLDRISDLFARSSEFRSHYGALGDAGFVELVYENVLGRDADPAGRSYWVGRLRAGLTRGRVMRFFSESAEYRHDTATGVPPGWRAGANALKLLAALRVTNEPARVGYSPTKFPHWDDTDHDGCDTRCEVLASERRPDGRWFSWWDGKLVSVSGYLDLDHVVDLAEAWDSGASTWGPVKRDAFADWQVNLVAVGQTINTAKGDRDAAGWKPPRRRSECLFAETTITTKFHWDLAVDPAEKFTLAGLLKGCSRPTSDPPPVSAPPPPRNVILYGDSLSMESGPFFAWFAAKHGYRAVRGYWGGTAPCDWFAAMRRDRYHYQPAAVVMQFSGADITPCMAGRDRSQAYREDARTATQIFVDAGVPVVWVSTPLPEHSDAVIELNGIEREAALELRETWVDAGAAVLENGHYSTTLPCLPSETAADGCVNGRIIVRSPDHAHLCPTQRNFPCPIYSSGAVRYGAAQFTAALVGARRV